MSLKKFVKLMLFGLLLFIFIFLSFFVYIIIKSDFLDIKSGRLDYFLFFKDFIFVIFWLSLIPLANILFRKIKKS